MTTISFGNTTVLPAAAQTRALERQRGHDLLRGDSAGDDGGRGWDAGDGVERLDVWDE